MNLAILRALLFCISPEGFWGLPALCWGEPGTGKTSMMKAIARMVGLHYYRLSPAERGEGAFGVVPVPGADGLLHYPAPAWTQQLVNGGTLFLDEIGCAPPALQAPLLGCVQLRTIGDHTFNNRVRVIGAANEAIDAAGGWDLSPALHNRFGHFDFEGLSAQDWSTSLLSGFNTVSDGGAAHSAERIEADVLAAWPAEDALSRGMVSGFITRRPDFLHKRPARGSTASKAWPSRRSNDYARAAFTSARIQGLSEIDTDTLVSAFVGRAWIGEYRAWARMLDLPAPIDVVDRKVKFIHDPRRLDRTLAVLSACAALVVPVQTDPGKQKQRKDRADAVWELIGAVIKDAPDVTVPAGRAMIDAKLVGTITATNTLARLHPVLAAAGLTAQV